MRIACIYWKTSAVGGIATHLNTLRRAALRVGDTFDILHSDNWKTKEPTLFPERQWVRGGDTKIWVDGEVPHHPTIASKTNKWLEQNYDAIVFSYICPHKTRRYPNPDFLPLYDCKLPKVAWVMDGHSEKYEDWARPLLKRLKAVLAPLESYAVPIREWGYNNIIISPFPFIPQLARLEPKAKKPLLVWPHQWMTIKGIRYFLRIIPEIRGVDIELYSCGVYYYRHRTEPIWKPAIGKDLFQGFHGDGPATYFGNVDLPVMLKALQRAWFTVSFQGMTAKNKAYKLGSYNNAEVEALWYGAVPILHSSVKGCDLPSDLYIPVDTPQEVPGVLTEAIKSGIVFDRKRKEKAKEFVIKKHRAFDRYQDLRSIFE